MHHEQARTGEFQSTPPARGATNSASLSASISSKFQSTPPARGATAALAHTLRPSVISIHAPREGGDWALLSYVTHFPDRFQSTPPARGATVVGACVDAYAAISIHAPREGGDVHDDLMLDVGRFQSTPPARGATSSSILATAMSCQHFNPRPPRGGRLLYLVVTDSQFPFQSTPPARGATERPAGQHGRRGISIHAPREGGDNQQKPKIRNSSNFNPRPPRGGRP